MTTTFAILGSIFGLISAPCFKFDHIYLGLLFVAFALISFGIALFAHFNKSNKSQKEGGKNMKLIGKKVVVKIGGSPPEDESNEIVGEETVVHVPESEIGKYDKIVGEETKLIIGGEEKKGK